MKLSMETMYFPEAKFHHKKEMMADWVATSEKAAKFSWVSVASCVAAIVSTIAFKDEFFFIYIGCALIFLIGALFCKKWFYPGYLAVLAGEVLSLIRFYLEMPENKVVFGAAIIVAVLGLIPSFFAFRCILRIIIQKRIHHFGDKKFILFSLS